MRVAICQIGEDEVTTRALSAHVPAGVEIVAAPPEEGDVLFVRAGCVVGPMFLEGLADAAASDAGAATASPVLASQPLPRAPADAPYPRLTQPPTACLYIRRAALQLAGPVDEGFAERCLALGLQHLLAGDVVVGWGATAPASDRLSAAARVTRVATLRARPLSVTIDGRSLGEQITGTQVHVLELIAALRRYATDAELRVIVPDRIGEHARLLLDDMPTVTYGEVHDDRVSRTDVVHRPHQVTSEADVGVLERCGERIVVTHQDLIAYRNPAYHLNRDAWETYRRLTRAALGFADLVVFESSHAAADAAAEDLAIDQRARIVPIGTDHRVLPAPAPTRPDGVPDGPFLLVLGTDYLHKNRLFAHRIAAALHERHGWPGTLVLAGPRADHGSSAGAEETWREAHPDTPVADVGPVSEPAKRWLYEHASAVLYPTTYEGFGLIPFEAAAHATPCLWAAVTSLADVLDPALATLVPWDAVRSADRAIEVLRDPAPHVAAVRDAASRYTWQRTALELLDVYAEVAGLPARVAATATADALAAETLRAGWETRYWELWQDIGPAGLALVGPDDPLLTQEDRRTLAGLMRRPATGRVVGAALRGLRQFSGR